MGRAVSLTPLTPHRFETILFPPPPPESFWDVVKKDNLFSNIGRPTWLLKCSFGNLLSSSYSLSSFYPVPKPSSRTQNDSEEMKFRAGAGTVSVLISIDCFKKMYPVILRKLKKGDCTANFC